MQIKNIITDKDIMDCWDVIYLLRPFLVKSDFLSRIKTMRSEGYNLIAIVENDQVVSIAGYRFLNMLYCGKVLYVDDLSTLESHRGRGCASKLMEYLTSVASENNCDGLHLDSGPTRHSAHRLYLNSGLTISAFHFSKSLKE